jgi:hypothetical protein
MAQDICKNHPGRAAVGHCETCHIPLCEKCAVSWPGTDRIFCSPEHAERFVSYQERRDEMKIPRKRPKSIFVLLPMWIVIMAVVLVVASIAYYLITGITPSSQIATLRGIVGL